MSKALIKMYYRMGIYSAADLDTFVKAGYITEKEAEALMQA